MNVVSALERVDASSTHVIFYCQDNVTFRRLLDFRQCRLDAAVMCLIKSDLYFSVTVLVRRPDNAVVTCGGVVERTETDDKVVFCEANLVEGERQK